MSATSTARPYRQTYDYNAFGNLTNRTGEVWDTTADPLEAAYTNNRRDAQYWAYDADGRNTSTETMGSYFNAAGRRYMTSEDLVIEQTFDGDGRRIKQTEGNGSGQNVKKRYYIQSSVLGTIYEIEKVGTNWVKRTGVVYLNGQRIAVQNLGNNNTTQNVWWFYENPVTGSTRGTTAQMASEPDPMGINNGTNAPPQPPC